MEDTRNVADEFKGMPQADIIAMLDDRGVELEIAVENLERDFNMGTIVRNANAFGVRTVHVIGRRQWNKRGAMMTDSYLRVVYHPDVPAFVASVKGKSIIAIDNITKDSPLQGVELPRRAVMVFGSEGLGLSDELLSVAEQVVSIEQLGSTRSVNVGVASGIAIYEWLRRHHL